MIQLSNISKTYVMGETAVHALRDVSLRIRPGELIAVMGSSGSGKSTLLHVLGFLDTPDTGSYRLFGKDTAGFSDDQLAALRNKMIGFVFQQFHLLRRMPARDNVALPCLYSSVDDHAARAQALEKLAAVGLSDRSGHWSNELSGGQQQRVAIARALMNDPMMILADEPTGNLDTASEKEIMDILLELNRQGKTVIIVTHEQEVAQYAHRVITMRDGQVVADETQTPVEPASDTPSVDLHALFARHSIWKREELLGHMRQAVNAILSNKIRSFLSMLGILVGVAAVIAMLALGEGAQRSMETQLKSLGSNLLSVRGGSRRMGGARGESGSVTRFSFDDVKAVAELQPYVAHAAGFVSGTVQAVYGHENMSTTLEGADDDYGQMRSYIPTVGRWFTHQEIQGRAKVAVIGPTVAEQLFGTDQNPVGKTMKLNKINFRVIGVFPAKGSAGPRDQDNAVLIPVTTAMYRVLGKSYLDGIYVEIARADLIEPGKTALSQLIKKRHRIYRQDDDSFNIWDMSEIQSMLSTTTRTMGMLLGCIAAISLFVGGIGIMNIMLVSVTERTREIGLRKALGARKMDILMQFLIESMVMTLSGGVLGICLGGGAALLLSLLAGWATHVSLMSVALATVFSVAVGVGFGLWPARTAAELRPVEALRYE